MDNAVEKQKKYLPPSSFYNSISIPSWSYNPTIVEFTGTIWGSVGGRLAMADAIKLTSEASSSGNGGNSERGESVVVDVGRRKSTCGYCKSGARTSISHSQFLYFAHLESVICFSPVNYVSIERVWNLFRCKRRHKFGWDSVWWLRFWFNVLLPVTGVKCFEDAEKVTEFDW